METEKIWDYVRTQQLAHYKKVLLINSDSTLEINSPPTPDGTRVCLCFEFETDSVACTEFVLRFGNDILMMTELDE